MSITEKEAGQKLREFIRTETADDADERTMLAYLDHLERAYLDSKAQRDEDEHPSLVKIISLDGSARSTRLFFGGSGVRNVMGARLSLEAGHRFPATLRLRSMDETALHAQQKVAPQLGAVPEVNSEIVLASFVFRGVRA